MIIELFLAISSVGAPQLWGGAALGMSEAEFDKEFPRPEIEFAPKCSVMVRPVFSENRLQSIRLTANFDNSAQKTGDASIPCATQFQAYLDKRFGQFVHYAVTHYRDKNDQITHKEIRLVHLEDCVVARSRIAQSPAYPSRILFEYAKDKEFDTYDKNSRQHTPIICSTSGKFQIAPSK